MDILIRNHLYKSIASSSSSNIFYVAFFIYSFSSVLQLTNFVNLSYLHLDFIYQVARIVAALLLIFILFLRRYPYDEFFLIVALGVVCLISVIQSGYWDLMISFLFIFSSNGIKISRLSKIAFFEYLFIFIGTAVASKIGFIQDIKNPDAKGQIKESLGFTHPNTLAAVAFALCCSYAIMNMGRMLKKDLIVYAIGFYICWSIAKSRTSALTLIIFVIFMYVCNNSQKILRMHVIKLIAFIFLFLVFFSIICMIFFDPNSLFFKCINDALSGRLEFSHHYYELYGIHPFGFNFDNVDVSYVYLGANYKKLVIDNAFCFLLLQAGWIPSLIFFYLYFMTLLKSSKCKDSYIFLGMMIYAIASYTEGYSLWFSFNYSMIGMYYLYKQNRKFQIGQQDLCTSSSVI